MRLQESRHDWATKTFTFIFKLLNKSLIYSLNERSTWCAVFSRFSYVWLFATPWIVAHQVPVSMGFSRQEQWNGLPFPPPGDLPNPWIKPVSPISPPDNSVGKESTCNAGDPGSIPGLGRSPGEGIGYPLQYSWASLVAQLVKNLPAMQETWVWFPGWVGKIPWRRERLPTPVFWPGEFRGLYSPWSHRIRHDWATLTSLSCIFFIGRRFLYH